MDIRYTHNGDRMAMDIHDPLPGRRNMFHFPPSLPNITKIMRT